MRSPRTRRLRGDVKRRRMATETPKGGLATTRNGRVGSRRSAASVWTTVTRSRANRERRCSARTGWSSKAMTLAPRRTKGAVMAPKPAPISSTRSPRLMPASSTRRWACWLESWCHPQRGGGAGTADHREHCHGSRISRCAPRRSRAARRPVNLLHEEEGPRPWSRVPCASVRRCRCTWPRTPTRQCQSATPPRAVVRGRSRRPKRRSRPDRR